MVNKIQALKIPFASNIFFTAHRALAVEKLNPFATGGTEAAVGAFPAAVIVDTPLQYCGGTIIDPYHIITAAACVLNEDFEMIHPKWFTIIAGDVFFSPPSVSRVTKNVENIFVHQSYSKI